MYRAREALVLHATATPYRDRSHFDAQNVLEAGGIAPSGADGGWLNRALAALDDAGNARDAVALADSVPLVLRGELAVSSWAPSRLPVAGDDLLVRLRQLYWAADPALAQTLYDALEVRAIVGDTSEQRMDGRAGLSIAPLASAAARFLASPDGPRIAVLDAGGWDTHANQGGAQGPLAQRLRGLDDGLEMLKSELGAHWLETTVLVVTEFGRAAAVNGTRGTDHGTAGCAFVVGGAVARRTCARRLAGARCTRSARRPRPARHDGSARAVQGRAARALQRRAKPRSRARSSPPATPSSRSTG